MTANRLANRTFLWQGLKSLIAILVVIVYSRLMGAEGRGQLSIWLINVQFFMLLLEWMVGSTVPNFMVKYGVRKTVKFSVVSTLAILIIWLIMQGSIVPNIKRFSLDRITHGHVVLGACLLAALSAINVLLGYFQYKGWVEQRNRFQVKVEIFKLIFLLGTLAFLSSIIVTGPLEGLGVLGMIWLAIPILNLMSVMVVLVLATWFSVALAVVLNLKSIRQDWKLPGNEEPTPPSSSKAKGWKEQWWLPHSAFRDGFWSQAGHLLYFAITRSPLWLINVVAEDKSVVGILANVWLMWDTLMIVGNSYGVVIHSMALTGANTETRTMLSKFTQQSLMRSLLLCIAVIAIPSDVFTTIFGWEFGGMGAYFAVVSPVVILASVASPSAHWLHATNRFIDIFRVYLTSGLVYFVCVCAVWIFPSFVGRVESAMQQVFVQYVGYNNFSSGEHRWIQWEVISLIPAFIIMVVLLRRSVNRL